RSLWYRLGYGCSQWFNSLGSQIHIAVLIDETSHLDVAFAWNCYEYFAFCRRGSNRFAYRLRGVYAKPPQIDRHWITRDREARVRPGSGRSAVRSDGQQCVQINDSSTDGVT